MIYFHCWCILHISSLLIFYFVFIHSFFCVFFIFPHLIELFKNIMCHLFSFAFAFLWTRFFSIHLHITLNYTFNSNVKKTELLEKLCMLHNIPIVVFIFLINQAYTFLISKHCYTEEINLPKHFNKYVPIFCLNPYLLSSLICLIANGPLFRLTLMRFFE